MGLSGMSRQSGVRCLLKEMKVKSAVSLMLIASMMIPVCSCSSDSQTVTVSHDQWIDSNLFENIDKMATADIKDDFAAAVNYEWASQQVADYTYPVAMYGETMKTVATNKRAMIEDESFQNKNIELVRIADELFTDWEYRDSIGVEPLKKYLAYIDEIEDIDDVSAYMIDNDRNPFAISLVKLDNAFNDNLDDCQALIITKPKLSLDKTEYYIVMGEDGFKKRDNVERAMQYMFGRCGYSDKEAEKIINDCFGFESKMVNLDSSDYLDRTVIFTMDDAVSKAGNYPLKEMLDHYKIVSCEHCMGELSYLDKLENIYTQDNVEGMKAFFKVRLAMEAIFYLDAGCYDAYKNSKLDRSNKFAERVDLDSDYSFFWLISQTSLTAAMDQAYLDYYFDQNTYDEIHDFIRLLKEKYKILINSNENLSEESKKALCNKLDKMRESILVPSNKADFTGVEFKTKAEGGTYLDLMCVLSRISNEHVGEIVQMKCDRTFWDIYDSGVSTTATNAMYDRTQNCIFIQLGIMSAPIYSPDYTIEQKLGYFVPIIGHEISHAFDTSGIYNNEDGKAVPVVSSDELTFWSDTSTKILTYFSGIHAFEGSPTYNMSSQITGEVVADIEGLKVSLMIAEDYDNFDYDVMFRSYASYWRVLCTKSEQITLIQTDPHPLEYLRANYTLMQFDEFIETYDLKPGDGMYLPPEQRTVIW